MPPFEDPRERFRQSQQRIQELLTVVSKVAEQQATLIEIGRDNELPDCVEQIEAALEEIISLSVLVQRRKQHRARKGGL
jgi:hypothetical protein